MAKNTDIGTRRSVRGEFALLSRLYRTIIETKDLRSAYRATLQTVCEATGWHLGLAWVPSPDETEMKLYTSWHLGQASLTEFVTICESRSFTANVGMTGRVWQTRKPEWTANLAAESEELFPLAPFAARAAITAALAVPIVDGDKALAVLLFGLLDLRKEDGNQIELVSEVAAQLGFALRHKRAQEQLEAQESKLLEARDELEKQVRERTEELTTTNEILRAEVAVREEMARRIADQVRRQATVAEIGQRALGGVVLSQLMDEIVVLVAQTLDVEFCKILELLPNGKALRLRAGIGWKDGLVGSATVNSGAESQAGYTLFCKGPVIVENLHTETRFSVPPLLREHGIVSGMSVIIGRRDRPFGVLGAYTARRRMFTQDDIHFLEAVAHMVSLVIEQSNATEQIRRSANWLERLIETTQDAVVSIDRRGYIVRFNAVTERVFGYGASEIVGRKFNDLMAEPYATEHDDYISRYEQTGEPRAIGRIRTVEGRRKNGDIFPLELSVTQVATSDDEEVRYAAFIRDISEVRRGQAWLQSMIETTQDAVLSIDRQGRIVLFNPAAERIFGHARADVIGQKVNMLMAEPYAAEHDDYIARYEKTGEARAIGRIRTVTAKRKNGELFPIELSVTEIKIEQNIQYAAFIRDISEKTRLQSQLSESERLATIGTTAAKIGHELANPLNGMSLTIQLLEHRLNRQPGVPDGQVTSTVKRLKDEINRLNKLVGQFGTISRRERYVFRPAGLGDLIDDVVAMQAPHFARLGIELTKTIAGDLPNVSMDSDRLKQAVLNLLKNAAEAMPNGGKIAVDAFAMDGGAVMEISDNGIGIPLDIDAFEPFVTTKKEGTGVGLVIVRQIVTAHGGKISYRSQPGKGTTFRIELPSASS